MSRTVKVKDVIIGEGLPKICVPMTGETVEELIEEANILNNTDLDIIEWRVDFFNKAVDVEKVKKALKNIRNILTNIPIIFTFRTKKEGGQKEISEEDYFTLNKAVAETKLVDIIDIELFNDKNNIKQIIEFAHKNNIAVIISNHDFNKTPSKEEIISRLRESEKLGGDIPKIAVMPNSIEDVITLLDATRIAREEYINSPIITMSMAGKGVISRIAGEIFGSSLTFGAVNKASAPGQISVVDLRNTIEILHKNL